MPKAVNTYTSPGLPGFTVDAQPEQAQSIGGTSHPNGRPNGSLVRSRGTLTPAPAGPQTVSEKYPFSEDDDAVLRSCYGSSRRSKGEAIELIQKRHPKYPRHAIVRRARRLGLIGQVSRSVPWSNAEIKRLSELKQWPLHEIVEALGRSPDSVRGQMRRQRLNADFLAGFKTKDVVNYFLVNEVSVERWIRRGWAKREHGRITEDSIHNVFRQHPEEIPFDSLAGEWQDFLRKRANQARPST